MDFKEIDGKNNSFDSKKKEQGKAEKKGEIRLGFQKYKVNVEGHYTLIKYSRWPKS